MGSSLGHMVEQAGHRRGPELLPHRYALPSAGREPNLPQLQPRQHGHRAAAGTSDRILGQRLRRRAQPDRAAGLCAQRLQHVPADPLHHRQRRRRPGRWIDLRLLHLPCRPELPLDHPHHSVDTALDYVRNAAIPRIDQLAPAGRPGGHLPDLDRALQLAPADLLRAVAGALSSLSAGLGTGAAQLVQPGRISPDGRDHVFGHRAPFPAAADGTTERGGAGLGIGRRR